MNSSVDFYDFSQKKVTAERSEFDINIGYYILPTLLVTLGYKNIKRNFLITENVMIPDPITNNYSNTANANLSGLTLGISGMVPLSVEIGMYGNFAYGLNMETEWKSGVTYGNDYYIGEFGVASNYKLDTVPILNNASVYIGYRLQTIKDNLILFKDYTQGFVLGVNLAF